MTMNRTRFSTAIDDRYLDDYIPGATYEFGDISVDAAEIISFAERYDPQAIHTDPVAAATGPFGGIIASGWQTCGLVMRLCVEHYLSRVASIASPGIDELRWLKPVRPGDRLSLRVTVIEIQPSRSKPDRGILRSLIEVLNQDSEVVMSMVAMNMLLRRKIV
jgi:acyl dehydratase